MDIENIKYIHHYTSIENLALILSSRKIRFTRIDKVDDLKEIEGLPTHFGTYVYISCWTHNIEENIALWKMYTNNMRGVRITLPVKMFKEEKCNINAFGIENPDEVIITPFANSEMINDNYCICNDFKNDWDFFDEVHYKDDYGDYYSRSFNLPKTGGFYLNPLGIIGRYKKKIWEFQNECRFKLYLIPLCKNETKKSIAKSAFYSMQNEVENKFEYFDVELNNDVLNEIIVRKGPLCNVADVIIIESLLEKFTLDGNIEESTLASVLRK